MNRNVLIPGYGLSLITPALIALFLLFSTGVRSQPEFMTMDQYFALHPEQKSITAAFETQVREPAKPIQDSSHKPVEIAVIYPAIQASDYWRRSVTSFEARLKELGVRYNLKTYFSRPSGDAQLQNRQLLEAVRAEVDYLVFTFNQKHHQRLIEKLLVRRKPKLILQNITTPVSRWLRHRPMMYVGFDHATGSQKMARRLAKTLDPDSKYLMLYYADGYISEMRGETFARELSLNSTISQVASFYTNGNRQKAADATSDTLKRHPDIDLIFANSTDIALGAIDALNQFSPSHNIMVNGWGGGDAELKALINKQLSLTVMRMNDDNGVAMAEAIKLDIENRSDQIPHVYSGDLELIDQKTTSTDLDALKERAFRYSGLK